MMSEKSITAKIGYLFFCPVDSGAFATQQGSKKKTGVNIQEVIDGFSRTMTVVGDNDADKSKIMSDIKTGEDFLYGGKLKFPCHRYLFPEMCFSLPNVELTDCHVLLTLFEEANTCEVAIECTAETDSVENLVFMRQIFLGSQPFAQDGKSIPQLADVFLKPFGGSASASQIAYLIEISNYFGSPFPEEALSQNANELYGIMTGDEGYAFISSALSEQRLANRWSTRNFVSAVVFHNNFLLLNFSETANTEHYRTHQGDFGTRYYGAPNPYFLMDSVTAGVNHGIYFSCEAGMVAKTISANVLNRQSQKIHTASSRISEEIRSTKDLRRDLILTLNRLEGIGMAELGELDRMIMDGLEINPLVEKIKYLLELLESELDLLYQTSTNNLMNILTICGLLLAAAQVVLAFFV